MAPALSTLSPRRRHADGAAVRDAECVAFLQWALPQLHLRWAGFRKVRRQVCRRIGRRLHELALPDIAAYRAYLESTPSEWRHLDGLCHVTISRFYRDPAVFEFLELERTVVPGLAQRAAERGDAVEVWSVGCASGEEPYSLVLAWEYAVEDLDTVGRGRETAIRVGPKLADAHPRRATALPRV